jgi:hypothetical protein
LLSIPGIERILNSLIRTIIVTKNTRNTKTAKTGKGALKVGKLVLNKETVKDLTSPEAKKIKGGKIAETGDCPSHACTASINAPACVTRF